MPKAAPANAKLLKSDLRYGRYTYLVTNTSPDAAADYVRKAVGNLFSVECLPNKAGKKA